MLRWILSLILVALVLVMSLIGSSGIVLIYQWVASICMLDLKQLGLKVETISDIGHGVVGFVLTLSLCKSLQERLFLTVLALAVLFSGCELLQSFTETRQANIADVARSAIGIGLAAALIGGRRLLYNHISKKAF